MFSQLKFYNKVQERVKNFKKNLRILTFFENGTRKQYLKENA